MAQKLLRALCVALIVILPLAACAPVTAQPTATPQPTVQATATPTPAQPMILVLPGYSQKSLIAVNRHLSTVLKNKGWNTDFYTAYDSQQDSADNPVDGYLKYVTTQLAADAMAFVQWVAASQEDGDALLYGQQGEDYTLQGERIALSETMRNVIDGGNLLESNSGAFAFYILFGGFVQRRIPVEAPRNAEDMLAVVQPQQLAAPWLTDLWNYRLPPYPVSDMPPDILIQSRNNDMQALLSLFYDGPSVLPTADELLKGFHSKDSATLLQWYQERVDRARAKAGQ